MRPLNHIDVGLDILCKMAKPSETLKLHEIAEVCGCSRQAIYEIEQKALAKLRVRALRNNLQDFLTE